MEVVPHADAGAFTRLARPLLEADPLRHTSVLTVLDSVCRGASTPADMLTVRDGDAVVGALLRTVDRPALVSGVPPRCAATVVDALVELGIDPHGAQGPRAAAEAFAAAWTARTAARTEIVMRMRLFALEELMPRVGVPGSSRVVAPDDEAAIGVLAAWREAFGVEMGHGGAFAEQRPHALVRAQAATAGELLWEVDGAPVAQAAARAVTAGMSRIGPVYTPPAATATPPPSRPPRRAGHSTTAPGTCCSTPTSRTRRRTGSTPGWASAPATTRSNSASCPGDRRGARSSFGRIGLWWRGSATWRREPGPRERRRGGCRRAAARTRSPGSG